MGHVSAVEGIFVSSGTAAAVAVKRERDQFLAGWAGLAVCGLVAAVIWFFGVKAVIEGSGVETSALECTLEYGISETDTCARP